MKKQDETNQNARNILKNLKKNKNPKPVGWGPVSAVLVTLGIYFGSQIIAGYLIVQYLLLAGISKNAISSRVDNSVWLQFFFILFAEVAALVMLWTFLRRRKISWQRIGVKKPKTDSLVYAIFGYGAYFIAILLVFSVLQQFVPGLNLNQNQQIGFNSAAGLGALSVVFMSLVILPAVTEEIIVRGFLFGGLRNKLPFLTSAILTSLIFGMAHLQLGDGDSPVWVAAIDTFILSMVLVTLREKTGNIWAGVVVHLTKNSLAFLTLFIIKP